MTITTTDIYNRLIDGEEKSAIGESIAEELNALLDEAFEMYDNYLKEKEAKAKAAEAQNKKKEAAQSIFSALENYAKLNGIDNEFDLSSLNDDEVNLMTGLLDVIFNTSLEAKAKTPSPKASVKIKTAKKKSDDDVLKNFLDELFN